MLHELTRQEGLYEAARLTAQEAQQLLKHSGDDLDRDQLKENPSATPTTSCKTLQVGKGRPNPGRGRHRKDGGRGR